MAASWPTHYQQGQAQPQAYVFNAYQQPNGHHQAQQAHQQPYGQQFQGQPYSQQGYVEQPQQYPQQPMTYPDYSQQIQNAAGGFQPQQPLNTPMPQHYQYGPPERQLSGHQAFNQPLTAMNGFYPPGQPQASAGQNQYSTTINQYVREAPFQHTQVAPGSYQNSHQQTRTASVASQRSNSFTQTSTQPPQSPAVSTPQQYQSGPPGRSSQEQSPQFSSSPIKDEQKESKPHPCFNCGSYEHWAVSCPEPPREVPAGAVNRQNLQHPAKRQKFNAPIITKYQVPPHVAHTQNPPHVFQPTSFVHPTYAPPAQYPVPSPTVTALSPPTTQWPQSLPQQHSSHPLSGYPSQQPASYQQQPHALTPHTPPRLYGSTPMDSIPPPSHQHISPVNPPYSQQQQHHHQQSQNPTTQGFPGASPYPTQSLAATQVSRYPKVERSSPSDASQGLHGLIPPTPSQATTPKPPPPIDAEVVEDEKDDLNQLDIPDLTVVQGGPIPTLVGRPLPANFIVADALAPFAAPAIGDNGLCRSKYPDRPDYNAGDQNIRDTEDWENHKKDPIFQDLPVGGNVILLSVLDLIYRPTRFEEPIEEPDAVDADNNRSQYQDDDSEQQNQLDGPRDDERRSHFQEGEIGQTERERSSPYSPQELISEAATEDVPIPLGPTGPPRPITLPPRPCPPPTPQDKFGDNKNSSRSRSASPRRYEYNSYQNISPPDSGADNRSRLEDRSNQRHDSHNREQSSRHWSEHPISQRFEQLPPPPPPPPPARKPSWHDRTTGSPLSTDPIHVNHTAPGSDYSMQNGNETQHSHHVSESTIKSPIRLRTERSYSQRMEYKIRADSPDEDETVRRRQADDVTPRLKRRQPKVAEAYSRRW